MIKVYNHGSIIESRLSQWLEDAWNADRDFVSLPETVPYGETEEEMEKLEAETDMPVLIAARTMRVDSRTDPRFRGKVINALRAQFGGHNPHKDTS